MRALFYCCALFPLTLAGQFATDVNKEQKPSGRDPRYIPPSLPEHLQPESSPALLFSPDGSIDLEKARENLRKGERNKEQRAVQNRARDYYNQSESRSVYEKKVLRQFGLQQFRYADPDEPYSETPGRRFQIVYFLSLPFTAALAGGLYSLSLHSRGDVRSLTFYETAGALAAGALLSGGIAYYDHRRVYGASRSPGALQIAYQWNF
ncbi:MAG: hypothetical protein HS115_02220 [Spirochaetales bacterium]|nr:hypothetical protein [Spirochaetales bacterium]